MDLRQYYKKLHELESKTPEAHVVVVSEETGDGGKAGVMTEAPRRNACQLILEGRARLAKPAEVEEYRTMQSLIREEFHRAKRASRVQVQLVEREMGDPTSAQDWK